MPVVTQAEYARHRGVSKVNAHRRTMTVGGPIPVHGPKKLIDVAQADALWDVRMSLQAAGSARAAAARKRPAEGQRLPQRAMS